MTKLAQESCGLVNWPARHDHNSVDRAVKLQTNQHVFVKKEEKIT